MSDLDLGSGVFVPSMEGIKTCYKIFEKDKEFSFVVVLDIRELEVLVEEFIDQLEAPCFFILELPTNQKQEKELRTKETDPFHIDIYYKDSMSNEEALVFFRENKEILLNDGMSRFGFSAQAGGNQLMVGKYKVTNIFTIYSEQIEKILTELEIAKVDSIKTVWDNFTQEKPGRVHISLIEGMSIYDYLEVWQEEDGLYFVHSLEDK